MTGIEKHVSAAVQVRGSAQRERFGWKRICVFGSNESVTGICGGVVLAP